MPATTAMIATSVATILFFRSVWKKRQIGNPKQTATRWLLSAKLLLSIFAAFVSITKANWMPDTLALAADLLNILLLTSETCKLWSLLVDAKAELNTSWTYLGSWAMITLYDIRTVLVLVSKLSGSPVFGSSLTVLQACSGFSLLALHVLPSYNKLADDTADNDKPKFGSQKSVNDSIRASGGRWMWMKKFRVFLSWTWPTGLVWMKFCVVLSLLLQLCETAVELLTPYLLSRFLKKLDVVESPLDARSAYLLYKAVQIAASGSGISNIRLLSWKPFELARKMIVRQDIFARIMCYSPVYHRGSNSISIATACDKGQRICSIFDFVAFNMLPHMIKLISTGIALIYIYGIRVAIIQWASAVFNIIISLHMNRFIMSLYGEEQEAKEKTERRQHDALQGYTTVFSCNKITYEIQRFTTGLKEQTILAWRTWGCVLVCRLMMGLMHFGSEATAMSLLLRSLMNNEASDVGTVSAFEGYSDILSASLFFFTGAHDDIFDKLYDADQLRQLFETDATVQYGNEKLQCLEGRVNFRNVSCGHTNTDGEVEHIFNNLNCEIQPGKTTAFVGKSGAGKTTMLNLIGRHIEPIEGSIEVDGQDIKTLAQGELTSCVAYMEQNPHVMDDTFAANIAYGVDSATESEILAAAKSAGIDEVIKKRPQQYDTMVGGNGGNLSGGERQRLLLARTFMQMGRGSKILLLDEATSAVDTNTEDHMKASIKTLGAGCTCIIVAHRLTTVMHADEIIVFGGPDRRGIVQRGTHKELIKCQGEYLKLWNKHIGATTEEGYEA